jgi:hypothetical protein
VATSISRRRHRSAFVHTGSCPGLPKRKPKVPVADASARAVRRAFVAPQVNFAPISEATEPTHGNRKNWRYRTLISDIIGRHVGRTRPEPIRHYAPRFLSNHGRCSAPRRSSERCGMLLFVQIGKRCAARQDLPLRTAVRPPTRASVRHGDYTPR